MSFGRRGLEPGSQAAGGPVAGIAALRNAPRLTQPNDDIARKREAFLAAERARNAELGGGLSAAAERFAGSGAKPERSLMMAYLLWFILGQVSAHRFYLGAYRSAMAQVGLFAFVLICAVGNAVGPLVAVALVAWALWVLGDVFFIHKLHRALCRKPGQAAAAFA